jgi:hypothetical protein
MQFVDRDPTVVWHYTNAAGLLGIVSRANAERQARKLEFPYPINDSACTLRFTDALYLNDPMELQYGRKHLASVLRERLSELVGDERVELEDVVAWLDPPTGELTPDESDDRLAGGTYVACFSADDDSLSQWRGYASGQGYAIGFHMDQSLLLFPPLTRQPDEGWTRDFAMSPQVGHVVYGDDAALTYFREFTDLIVNPTEKAGIAIPRRYLAELALSMVKQDAYKVESEVRAVIVEGPMGLHREFRDGALGVTPYITAAFLPFGDPHSPAPLIRAVKVGPGGDATLRMQAVSRLLENEDFETDHIVVSASGFEYRGW